MQWEILSQRRTRHLNALRTVRSDLHLNMAIFDRYFHKNVQ